MNIPAMVGPLPVGLIIRASKYLSDRTVHLDVTGTARSPQIRINPRRSCRRRRSGSSSAAFRSTHSSSDAAPRGGRTPRDGRPAVVPRRSRPVLLCVGRRDGAIDRRDTQRRGGGRGGPQGSGRLPPFRDQRRRVRMRVRRTGVPVRVLLAGLFAWPVPGCSMLSGFGVLPERQELVGTAQQAPVRAGGRGSPANSTRRRSASMPSARATGSSPFPSTWNPPPGCRAT